MGWLRSECTGDRSMESIHDYLRVLGNVVVNMTDDEAIDAFVLGESTL